MRSWKLPYTVHPSVVSCREGGDATTVYPKKYERGFCFAVLCCGYTLTDFPISIRLTSLAMWQSNDCPSASKATLMNMDKYFMWIHYERLHNHNKAKHNKTVCIFLGIYCIMVQLKAWTKRNHSHGCNFLIHALLTLELGWVIVWHGCNYLSMLSVASQTVYKYHVRFIFLQE